MFEYPGASPQSENLKDDVQSLRRWLSRFIPELEQQLSNLGVDNFSTAYNERMTGLTTLTGAGKQKTTSEALAEHLLDRNNPHKVTLSQLGYTVPQAMHTETDNGGAVTLGGLTLQWKDVEIAAATGTSAGGSLYRQSADLGDWDLEFGTLLAGWIQQLTDTANWAGSLYDQDETSAGKIYIYATASSIPACAVRVYGLGGLSNGD